MRLYIIIQGTDEVNIIHGTQGVVQRERERDREREALRSHLEAGGSAGRHLGNICEIWEAAGKQVGGLECIWEIPQTAGRSGEHQGSTW